MRVKLAVVADHANASAEGKLNILGIFDRIMVPSLPAVHPLLYLVVQVEAHPAERGRSHPVELRLHDPDGEAVFDLRGEVVPQGAPGEPIIANQIIGINNLLLSKAGEYTFVVFVDNDLKAEIPLKVTVAELPPPPTGGMVM
ncbi:MAG: hypothetical protein IRZ00_01615 [Gemmatimonadetes bacterium]|nr:hypothetical protein [Gemmatimonadota bacterium]